MTRNEYMEALKSKLSFMAEGSRQATLDFYGEMLDDRMEDGMDETSAVAAMESPDDIAARLRAEQPEAAEEKAPEEAMTDEAMKFSSLADSILKATDKLLNQAAAEFPKTVEDSYKETKERLRKAQERCEQKRRAADEVENLAAQVQDAAEKYAGKIQDAAEQLAKKAQAGTGEEINGYTKKTLACPADSLQAVRLTGGEMPIKVKACEGGDVTLVYYTCEDDPYEAFVRDGELILQREEGGHKAAGRFSFSMLGGIIKLAWNKSVPTVELYVPKDALLDLEARTSNASVKVKGPRALCGVNLKSSNGRIALENVKCKALEAVSSNARLTLENVEVKQELTGKTSNSRIELDVVRCGAIDLDTSNGGIQADECTARETLRLGTSNGSIRFDRLDAADLRLTTSNGSISGELPGPQTDWRIESRTSNGHNSLPEKQPGGKNLTVRTSNGNIDVKFFQV